MTNACNRAFMLLEVHDSAAPETQAHSIESVSNCSKFGGVVNFLTGLS
jgi:hypothetical protein